MKYIKKMTVNEWKRFDKITTDRVDGNYLTMQEIMLSRYKIILTDHINKPFVGKMCPVPLKEQIKNIPKHITKKNFDKGMEKFDNGMKEFDKAMGMFSSGLGEVGKVNTDLNRTTYKPNSRDGININKLVGTAPKIWSTKTTKKKKKRRRKRKTNMDIIWGDKK